MKYLTIYLMTSLFFLSCSSENSDTQDNQEQETTEETAPNSTENTLTEKEIQEGWQLLFDGKSTDLWRGYNKPGFPEKGWTVEDGNILVHGGGGDLITKEQFENFELKVDFLLTDTANSGIFYLILEEEGTPIWHNAPEFQLLDNETYIQMMGAEALHMHLTGDNYDLHKSVKDHNKPVGEWNTARILLNNGHVEHWLNGYQTVEYEIDSPDWERRRKESKFAEYPNYGKMRKGAIGLQDHGHLLKFRNIKIRKL